MSLDDRPQMIAGLLGIIAWATVMIFISLAWILLAYAK